MDNIEKEIIKTYDDFVKKINEVSIQKNDSFEYQSHSTYIKNNDIIKNIIFQDFEIIEDDLYGLVFDGCEFLNVRFSNHYTSECIFNRCKFRFIKVFKYFDRSVFLNCNISESFFYTVHFNSIIFDKTFLFNTSISFSSEELIIDNCELFSCELSQAMTSNMYPNRVLIKNSSLGGCTIHIMRSRNYTFDNCEFSHNHFRHSELKDEVFINNTRTKNENYSEIDLSTLTISKKLSAQTLKKIFSITSDDAQEFVKSFFLEIKYETVFISFSFKNKEFAQILSQQLGMRGVRTRFWPEHAPGGKQMKDIMYNWVQENDRVIFICSKDSLRSEACHYEISEARKKGKKIYKDVPYPIYIDNAFLDDNTIRDIEKYEDDNAEEWIKNINWLRIYNAKDFTAFNQPNYDINLFNEAIDKLVADLRKPVEKEKA